jgi:hypothetical protein
VLIETVRNIPPEVILSLPLFAITISQVKAILSRDNHQCQFPDDHDCGGKLGVHHINGDFGDKTDDPFNLSTVCRRAHWDHLHNGASMADKMRWAGQLAILAAQNTAKSASRGWKFPS